MKKKFLVLSSLFLVIGFLGCSGQVNKNRLIIAKINNYEISQEEFENEFQESIFVRNNTLESRKEFLDNLIDRKLILQEAQAKGLDKEKGFLKLIERFWEQSLLKIALDKKTEETAGSVQISDKEIEQTYKNMLKEGKTTKTFDQMYVETKCQLMKEKESQMMNEWLEGLHKKAQIQINHDLLKTDK